MDPRPDDGTHPGPHDPTTRAWLTAVVGRVCVDKLRARLCDRYAPPGARPALPSVRDPEFDGDFAAAHLPAHHAALADAATAALLAALAAMPPAQRLAFALRDVFALEPDEAARAAGLAPDDVDRLVEDARRRLRGLT
jgi:RNA polymerase sigma-70 factor (ECF subfamily)